MPSPATRTAHATNPVLAAVRRLRVALAIVLLLPFALLTAAFARGPVTPPKIGETAPEFELMSLDGSKVSLSGLTAQGPVALIVLRGYPGYQCPFCTAQAGELMGKADQFAKAGAHVVFVYPGPADGLKQHAADFISGKGIPKNFTLVLDPDFAFTEKYGLRWNAPHETSYPSTFVIDKKGKVIFAKISHGHGGRAKSAEILAALNAPAPVAVPAGGASATP